MNAAEDLLSVHLAELGLHFIRQFRYAPGRKFRADFAVWTGRPCMSHPKRGRRLALIEVVGGVYHGKAHGSIQGILKDIDRLNAATLNGWRMLRFTPQQVANGTAKEMIRMVGGEG